MSFFFHFFLLFKQTMLQKECLLYRDASDNLPWHPIACHTRLRCSFVAAHLKAYNILSLTKLLF